MTARALVWSPRVSVIINTDGRAKALRATIDSLRQLTYRNFEVIVVCGPTDDGTREYVTSLAGTVKMLECSERNLSQSRNIGIAAAAGEIVAFIDDDAVAEPEWLEQLVRPFNDRQVGGAGGVVYNHTGYELQYRYAASDRLGNGKWNLDTPASDFNYPYTAVFPYVQGTNSAFRRASIVSLGGFDEEFEFYLDETDVCCRLVDTGQVIAQLPDARVHHKFLPSHIRDENRVTVKKFAVIKNKIYFSLVNNRGQHAMTDIVADALSFVRAQRADLEFHLQAGRLTPDDLEAFDADVERAWSVGLSRGLSGQRRNRPREYFAQPQPFVDFPTLVAAGPRRNLVFLSQGYPPGVRGGNARHTSDIARAIVGLGHTVHVVTMGQDVNRVDLEDGVWVHRIVPKNQMPRMLPEGQAIPDRIWNYSATMLEEIYRIDAAQPVDVVEGVSWDCECAATVLDGRFPSAINVVTSLAQWIDTHVELRDDPLWMATFGRPMLVLERLLMEESPGIVAASQAILDSLSERYGVDFARPSVALCPHGLEDMSKLPRRRPLALPDREAGRLVLLFVGRLELRKGIDVLLATLPELLAQFETLDIWIAGDDTIELDGGMTARAGFLADEAVSAIAERVYFLGAVSDEELRWLYANCDVFTSPSRFESFGLIFVEAMMFGRAIVGCRAGGVPEVVEDGVTGLLAEAGDVGSLAAALSRLLGDAVLRDALGAAGRVAFEQRFESRHVAAQRLATLDGLRRRPVHRDHWVLAGDVGAVDTAYGVGGLLLRSVAASVFIPCDSMTLYVTFWQHIWSGIVVVAAGGREVARTDLYAPAGMMTTLRVDLPTGCAGVTIHRIGEQRPEANDSEVILVAAGQR